MSDFITNGPLPLAIVCLIIGFVFLVKGADLFVEGSSSIAKKLKVPSIVIGLTIVAIGTSLPEAAVSITASVTNNNALAISNVLGSNIFNLMVVIGVCAILTPVAVQKDVVRRDLPFSVICALLLLVLGYMGSMSLGHVDGIILLLLYIAFLGFMIYTAMKARKAGNENSSEVVAEAEEIKIMSVPKSILFIVIGAVGIMIGGDVVVDSEPDACGTYHCCVGHIASGTGNFRSCRKEKRSGYGFGKCHWIQCGKHSDDPWYRFLHKPDSVSHGGLDRYLCAGCIQPAYLAFCMDEKAHRQGRRSGYGCTLCDLCRLCSDAVEACENAYIKLLKRAGSLQIEMNRLKCCKQFMNGAV